jgi:lysophospholipase L1-like esterase
METPPVPGERAPSEPAPGARFPKVLGALLLAGVGLALLPLVPGLEALHVRFPWQSEKPPAAPGEGAREEAQAPAGAPAAATATAKEGEQALPATENRETASNALGEEAEPVGDEEPAPVPIVHAEHLAPFFEALGRVRRKEPGARVRVAHYGDSLVTSDYVSGTVRRGLQARYGDAGHGFVLIANPWSWYFHNDVKHSASDGWRASRVVGPFAPDHRYGYGAVSFLGGEGASATFGTTEKGPVGHAVSRFVVHYATTPKGGEVLVKVDGRTSPSFTTRGPEGEPRVHVVEVEDGAHELELRVAKGGQPRLFGVSLERAAIGVVYDALGINGARAKLLSKIDDEHWKAVFALQRPNLVVLQYGTNESDDRLSEEHYGNQVRALVQKVKIAAPGVPVLVMAPLDRADACGGKAPKSHPNIPRIVGVQERVAAEEGVAFWNTFLAMGGEGSFARWQRLRPALGSIDRVHPTPNGAEKIGRWLTSALVSGARSYEGSAARAPIAAREAGAAP